MSYDGSMFIERNIYNVIEVQEDTSTLQVNQRLETGRWILIQVVQQDGELVYVMGRIFPDG